MSKLNKIKVLLNLIEKYSGKKVFIKEFVSENGEEPKQDITKFQNLFQQDYPTFIDNLSTLIKDEKVLKFLSAGLKDGKTMDDKFGLGRTSIACVDLKPTQSEVDISKSLNFPLKDAATAEMCLKGENVLLGGTPIVTFNKGYVIDGHHRWSQAFCLNPNAKMASLNLTKANLSPIEALKSTQVAVATTIGDIPIETVEGHNLFEAPREIVVKFVLEHITDEVVQVFVNLKGFKSKEQIAEYIWHNCEILQKNNVPIPNAPNRGLMPQTGSNLPGVIKQLVTGKANSKEPFAKPEVVAEKFDYYNAKGNYSKSFDFDDKDLYRIQDIIDRSKNNPQKRTVLARNMANKITDWDKALRRGYAAQNQNLDGIAQIFFARAKQLKPGIKIKRSVKEAALIKLIEKYTNKKVVLKESHVLFQPKELLRRAVLNHLISIDEYHDPKFQAAAEYVSQNWAVEDDYEGDFGSSDMTYATKDFLNELGIKNDFVDGKLTRFKDDGTEFKLYESKKKVNEGLDKKVKLQVEKILEQDIEFKKMVKEIERTVYKADTQREAKRNLYDLISDYTSVVIDSVVKKLGVPKNKQQDYAFEIEESEIIHKKLRKIASAYITKYRRHFMREAISVGPNGELMEENNSEVETVVKDIFGLYDDIVGENDWGHEFIKKEQTENGIKITLNTEALEELYQVEAMIQDVTEGAKVKCIRKNQGVYIIRPLNTLK